MGLSGFQVAILVLPYLLNDFIIIDYGTRIVTLALFVNFAQRAKGPPADFGLARLPTTTLIKWTVFLTAACVFIDRAGTWILEPPLHDYRLFRFPAYPTNSDKFFDLTFGVALVAISEEIIFRGVLLTYLTKRIKFEPKTAAMISILLFSAIHWSSGPATLITTFVWAFLPTYSFFRVGSIYPSIVAHFITDFVAFY
ncbi:MAG: type II CAAX endopeptidase family protein [Bdellovibrionia bacterium]